MPERLVARTFDGLYNFRDVGGLPAGDAGRTRPGVLYRSDAFGDVSPSDVDHLEQVLGIRRVIDLRAARETDAEPPTALDARGIDHLYRPIDSGPGNAIESAPAGERLAHRYLDYLEHARDSVVGLVRDLAEPGAPVTVVHCRAGKDRTGVTIGVVLALLGVDDAVVAGDYALTTIGMPRIMDRLRASSTYAANVARLPAEMYSSDAETMLQFLRLVRAQHGSVERWALDQGITPAELAQLRENLLEPTSA